MIVRWECGCVGIPKEYLGTERDLVFSCCDDWEGHYGFGFRGMNDPEIRPSTALTPDQIGDLARAMGRLIGEGYRFRDVQAALDIPRAES